MSSDVEIKVHPIQTIRCRDGAVVPQVVSMAAYEVYCQCFGKQEALVTGNCRGGFGVSELIAFLYAKSFPKNEWDDRVNEALAGMKGL